MSSTFIKHKPCPKCGSKDNLGEYTDHEYCFGCQYYKLKRDVHTLRQRYQRTNDTTNHFGITTVPEIPRQAMKWLLSYGISVDEIAKHSIEWSPDRNSLVLLNTGSYWQGRNFGVGPKYMSNGVKPLTIYGEGDILVLVEDILSAIKVSRVSGYCAVPLLGSSLPTDWQSTLTDKYDIILFWLDRDKAKNSIRFKNRIKSLGKASKVIITERDPKEYNTKEIEKWLKNR